MNTKNTKKIIVSIIVVLLLVLFLVGHYFVGYPIIEKFGIRENEVKRNIYEKNPQYIKGVADDIVKYMYEYNTTDDENEKKSIKQVVVHRFADFDIDDLNDQDLADFVRMCKGE